MATTDTAKVFMSGRSQAVRLPKAYRFDTAEVNIRRDARTGDVVLSRAVPVREAQTPSLQEIYARFDAIGVPDDFLADREQGMSQERDEF